MYGEPEQGWLITPEIILRTLPIARLVEIAVHFRISLDGSPSWAVVSAVLLNHEGLQAVPLMHLLTRRELGALCQLAAVRDEGPTQCVLAKLLPLCRPSPHERADA